MWSFAKKILLLLLCMGAGSSCVEQKPHLPEGAQPVDNTKENLLAMNVALAQKEESDIQHYVDSVSRKWTKSGSGFWYEIMSADTAGVSFEKGNVLEVQYNLYLLDGQLCYTPQEGGIKVITLGKVEETKALDEAIYLLKEGDSGFFVMPSNLAYGIAGDGKKIGAKKTIIYEVLSVKKLRE